MAIGLIHTHQSQCQLQQRKSGMGRRGSLKSTIDLAYSTAQGFVLGEKHKEAIPAALHALRLSTEAYGSNSVQLVPVYLLLAESSTGVGRLPEASKYLSQAEWIVLSTPDCSVAVRYKLHRSLGLFCAAKGNFEQALYHLANDIYLASSAFGLKSVETSGGYFHMANVFFRQNKMDVANSLYAEVTDIWHAFLVKSVQAQEQILKSRPEMSPFTEDKEVSKDHLTGHDGAACTDNWMY
ncbi:zinc finger MYND domain-containing protein 12 isoform 3-T3 [Morus bassanus]